MCPINSGTNYVMKKIWWNILVY